jgi:hypothetical protein
MKGLCLDIVEWMGSITAAQKRDLEISPAQLNERFTQAISRSTASTVLYSIGPVECTTYTLAPVTVITRLLWRSGSIV